jgi:hypothetical protein
VVDHEGRLLSFEQEQAWGRYGEARTWDAFGRPLTRVETEASRLTSVDEAEPGPLGPENRWEEAWTWLEAPPGQAHRFTSTFRDGATGEVSEAEFEFDDEGMVVSRINRFEGAVVLETRYEKDWNGDPIEVWVDEDQDGEPDYTLTIERDERGAPLSAQAWNVDGSSRQRWEFENDTEGRWVVRRYTSVEGTPWEEVDTRTWLAADRYELQRRPGEGQPRSLVRDITFDPATRVFLSRQDLYPSSCYTERLDNLINGDMVLYEARTWFGLDEAGCIDAWRTHRPADAFSRYEYGPFGLVRFTEGPAEPDRPARDEVRVWLEGGLLDRQTVVETDETGTEVSRVTTQATVVRDGAGRLTSWELEGSEGTSFRTWTWDDEGRLLHTVLEGYRNAEDVWVREARYTWEDRYRTAVQIVEIDPSDLSEAEIFSRTSTFEPGFPFAICMPDGEDYPTFER